jgi:hypothetical protein
MLCKVDQQYSVSRKTKITQVFGDLSQYWKTIVISRFWGKFAHNCLRNHKEINVHIQFQSNNCYRKGGAIGNIPLSKDQ